MASSAFRKLPLAVALLLSCAAMTFPAQAGWFSSDEKPAAKADGKPATEQPATNLDDSIRQAQMLRLAGQYPDAIKHLSQLMIVASDDARVISEYGKTLAAMGHASDAVNFLTRAQQLQPGDWTVYSAIGVAYDQLGDQKNAQSAYEHALAIKPEEPSVLNNYALSRMLAKDPEMARNLAARAERAGGTSDATIARNIVMIRSLAPETPVAQPVTQPAQMPVAYNQAPVPVMPVIAVTSNAAPVKVNILPTVAQPQTRNVTAQTPEAHDNRVVMQPVPVDPLAGPVQGTAKAGPVQKTAAVGPVQPATKPVLASNVSAATHAPRPLKPKAPQTEEPQAKPDAIAKQHSAKQMGSAMAKAAGANKSVMSPPSPPAPVKTAEAKVAPPQIARHAKTASVAVAKATPFVSVTAADAKLAPVKAAEANKSTSTPIVKMTSPAPVKTAETTPVPPKAIGPGKPAPVEVAKAAPSAPMTAADTKPMPAKAAGVVSVAAPAVAKATSPAPVKLAEAKPTPAKAYDANKTGPSVTLKMAPPTPVKTAKAGKPATAPKVLPPAPMKTAEAKPVAVKAATKPTDVIPGLRLTASAY